jgi:hypothetical protein
MRDRAMDVRTQPPISGGSGVAGVPGKGDDANDGDPVVVYASSEGAVVQWHPDGHGGSPMALLVWGGQLFLGGKAPLAPSILIGDIARGEWVDYVVHAPFSRSAQTGFAEVYRNGAVAVPMHARANMVDHSDYLKMGFYRDDPASATAVMWADGMRVTAP